jgi:hypothetical protein
MPERLSASQVEVTYNVLLPSSVKMRSLFPFGDKNSMCISRRSLFNSRKFLILQKSKIHHCHYKSSWANKEDLMYIASSAILGNSL